MSDTTNEALNQGGAQTPAPESTNQQAAKPAPRNDAEALQQEQAEHATGAQQQAAAKADEKKPNRTREYIDKLHRQRDELQRELAQYRSGNAPPQNQNNPNHQRGQAGAQNDPEPTLEDHDFDVQEFTRAHSAWAVRNELQKHQAQQSAAAAEAQSKERWDGFYTRAAEFADTHPDYFEVVGSIEHPLSQQVQDAIAAHPKGPELAYHLGNNDDDAFDLASIQPHLAAAAVERLAKRLSAAPAQPEANQPPQQQNQLAAGGAFVPTQNKPISQAPPPAPTVSGRSPTDVPPEKLTDDDWYKRERERERKR